MVSSLNIEKLTSLLKDFYTVTQIRITVFDESFREIASWPRERAEIPQPAAVVSPVINWPVKPLPEDRILMYIPATQD